MSNVNGSFDGKKFLIENLNISNFREKAKIKIFLNSNNKYNYLFENNKLEICFNIDDQVVITDEIIKIKQFISKTLNIDIHMDNMLDEQIIEVKNKHVEFDNSILNLKNLKNSDCEDSISFKEYCTFCDEKLSCKLRPYQYKASYYLTLGHGGFDFSVPGSGKTIITYAAYNYLKEYKYVNNILIVGPINSFNAWHDEYFTCFNSEPSFKELTSLSLHDAQMYLLSSSKFQKEITFINVDKVFRLTNEIIKFLSDKNCLLIIDEGHKEKNPEAAITKAVLEITKYVDYRIILTGTPMPNGYEDLYSLMKIYSPYKDIIPFNYGELKKMTKTGANEKQKTQIMESIKPIYSRVSKKHLLETGELLPAKFNIINCSLSKEQQEIYDFLNNISESLESDIDFSLNLNLMKAVLIRKMQVSANPALLTKAITNTVDELRSQYYEEFEKEDSNSEMLIKADNMLREQILKSSIISTIVQFDSNYYDTPKNLEAVNLALKIVNDGNKVIIWDVFVQNMDKIKDLISNISNVKVEVINGTVTGDDRQRAISNFKNGSSMILIANPATLAESISLHRCCQNAIYVNRNFNAAQFIQSKDRIHRINMPLGTTANYYFLLNDDTVDEIVHERLELKENRMLAILDSDEPIIGGSDFENNSFMSNEDIIKSYRK